MSGAVEILGEAGVNTTGDSFSVVILTGGMLDTYLL